MGLPLHDLPEVARKLLGAYEGLRGYHILPEANGQGRASPRAEPIMFKRDFANSPD